MELTEQAKQVLAAVRDGRGEWLNRKQIAQNLGRVRINPSDVAILDMLAAAGLIESRKAKTPAPSGIRMEHRAVLDE